MDENEQAHLARVAQDAIAAMDAFTATARRLAAVEATGRSADRRIEVRATATGEITELRLLDNVLRRYDTAALGELVTRTIREAQRKARENYEAALAELTPSEIARSEAELRRITRD